MRSNPSKPSCIYCNTSIAAKIHKGSLLKKNTCMNIKKKSCENTKHPYIILYFWPSEPRNSQGALKGIISWKSETITPFFWARNCLNGKNGQIANFLIALEWLIGWFYWLNKKIPKFKLNKEFYQNLLSYVKNAHLL